MSEIIYDDNNSGGRRFSKGYRMTYFHTSSVPPFTNRFGAFNEQCLSAVRTTKDNWYYICPAELDINFLKKWLEEIAPNFPTFDIKLISVLGSKIMFPGNNIPYPSFTYKDGTGRPITVKLKAKKKDKYDYSTVNYDISKEWYVGGLTIIMGNFLNYCIHNNILLDKNNYLKEIKSYFNKKVREISEPFRQYYGVSFYKTKDAIVYDTVYCNLVLDYNDLDYKGLEEYLGTIVEINLKSVIPFLRHRLGADEKDKIYNVVQALYSNKTYSVEAYLAHHLIRAGFSNEFIPFIKQYYRIKEKLPNQFFWNLIFLTLFGFNIYYYYWLTGSRTFKLITEEEFDFAAKQYIETSSQNFLDNFYVSHSPSVLSRLIELYTDERFDEMASILSNSIVVYLKPEKKGKFKNLNLSVDYPVSSVDKDYYFIIGDDYKMRRYSVKNFIKR